MFKFRSKLRKQYPEELRNKVHHMYNEGCFIWAIAKTLGISEFDVDEILGRNR